MKHIGTIEIKVNPEEYESVFLTISIPDSNLFDSLEATGVSFTEALECLLEQVQELQS